MNSAVITPEEHNRIRKKTTFTGNFNYMIEKTAKAFYILKNEGLSELTKKLRIKWFEFRYWKPISNDFKNMEILLARQRKKKCDLYDGLNTEDKERLIKLKNDLVIYLVKKNSLFANPKKNEDINKKWESYLHRLSIKADTFKSKSVLEVGSGHSCALHDCGARELVNIDPLMDVYSRHVNGFPDICQNIKFINSDVESIPLEDNKFDIIVCVNALDHFNDVLTSIKEMERLLKYDGLLLLNVDCKDRNKDRALKRVGHPYSFTKDKLHELFTHTSLQLIFEKDFSELSSITMHFRKMRFPDRLHH